MNKKVIERILKNLLENDTYTIEKEETRTLLNYIADLQRKEYNNSKAIEFIKTWLNIDLRDDDELLEVRVVFFKDLLNILEKGE